MIFSIFGTTRNAKLRPRSRPMAVNISAPATLTAGAIPAITYEGSYGVESNQPPFCEDVVIIGSEEVGQTLSIGIIDLVIPNGGVAGPHDYVWYRCTSRQGGGTQTQVGTDPTYLIQAADAGAYLRCAVTLRQYGHGNTTGDTYNTIFTNIIIAP